MSPEQVDAAIEYTYIRNRHKNRNVERPKQPDSPAIRAVRDKENALLILYPQGRPTLPKGIDSAALHPDKQNIYETFQATPTTLFVVSFSGNMSDVPAEYLINEVEQIVQGVLIE